MRAISIALVVLAHLSRTAGFPRLPMASGLAQLGVRVFFVISGFLITSLLLDEVARTGSISLGRFYLRRTLRIFPPFYVYVAAMALAAALGWIAVERRDFLAAVTYTTNYHHERSWYLGHAWSLAVEEQFYLLWPFLFKWLGAARAARVALATVVAAPLLRFALLVWAPAYRGGLGETFPTVADAIATGCLLACWRGQIDASPRLLAFLGSRRFWVIPAVALAAGFTPSAKLGMLAAETITNIGIALTIDRVVRFPALPSGRALNFRPVAFVGVLSYSLYLWQQPFINRHSGHWLASFPLNLVLACACALASYLLIERPSLRLRGRVEAAIRAQAPAGRALPVGLPPPG